MGNERFIVSVYEEINIDAIDRSKSPSKKELQCFQSKFSEDVIFNFAQGIGLDMEAFTLGGEERTIVDIKLPKLIFVFSSCEYPVIVCHINW